MAPEGDSTRDMQHVMKWHNGEKDWSPFSDQEMARRHNDLRQYMKLSFRFKKELDKASRPKSKH